MEDFCGGEYGAAVEFDCVMTEGTVQMGALMGSEVLLFIKTGQGSGIYGYEKRYLRMAERVRAKYGLSVVVSATESDRREVYEREREWVRERFSDPEGSIYCFGVSKGGLIACWYWTEEPRVRRILTVNAPLMINYHNRTLPAIRRFTDDFTARDRLTMVYGTLDPSYPYVPFVRNRARVEILEGADHNLTDYPVKHLDLVERWLLFDVSG